MTTTSEESVPREIRITSHGKIRNWVTSALEYFEADEPRSLVLHTWPREQPDRATGELQNVTLVVPRLISVVEIIKREYLQQLARKHSPRLAGLHQYNEMSCLENLGYGEGETEESRDRQIAVALEGKNHIKLKQTPYLRVTLSLERLPNLEKNATYQPPQIRKISKSAKARAKRRARKAQTAVAVDEGAENNS